ncbi:MAG TPA: GTP 3',8-cyclase MoaA [Geobacterales bacterium]|nr:GTP 3',8-cyclase MoaA [Geobacterales bacterium]
MELVDSFGRTINYLRLSVTDRCNLRCLYCMPPQGVVPCGHDEILSYEELEATACAAVALGVRKIRVTGGEPLVRRGIIPFLSRLAAIPHLEHLVLTSNGLLLAEMAADLKEAGVQRLNVSIDSLKPNLFATITRGGDLGRVLAGIEAAERLQIPIKLNMVVMAGVNDQELESFARLTLERSLMVRFIEYMPTIADGPAAGLLLSGSEIMRRLSTLFPLQRVERGAYAGPSQDFTIVGGKGSMGIITPVSGHLCASCNRIRVTSTGIARSCLFDDNGIDLKPTLRGGDMSALPALLAQIVRQKPSGHRFGEPHSPSAVTMSGIGG